MRKLVLFLACAAAPLAAAQAQNMPVAEFLQRSATLNANGYGPSTPEWGRLSFELGESARLARNERRIARRQDRAPVACLRPGVRAATTNEVFRYFRALPASDQQSLTVHQAYMRLMAEKFPCRSRRS